MKKIWLICLYFFVSCTSRPPYDYSYVIDAKGQFIGFLVGSVNEQEKIINLYKNSFKFTMVMYDNSKEYQITTGNLISQYDKDPDINTFYMNSGLLLVNIYGELQPGDISGLEKRRGLCFYNRHFTRLDPSIYNYIWSHSEDGKFSFSLFQPSDSYEGGIGALYDREMPDIPENIFSPIQIIHVYDTKGNERLFPYLNQIMEY